MNRVYSIGLALIISAFTIGSVKAQSIECDTTYTTKRGDSLSRIAGQAYGRTTAYQAVFDYNPGVLKSPSNVPVGVHLYIPCIDKKTSDGNSNLESLKRSNSNKIKILTGSDYAPYVDDGLPEGGFSSELVERAMQYNGGKKDYRIDVIRDWSSHLQPLLADGAYDLAFPWYKPDCSQMGKLGKDSKWRCTHLRFSEALHEVVVTFFARKGKAGAIKKPSDADGMKICRPRGYFTHDLEVMGLVPPAVIRVAGHSPTDCFQRLVSGEVDLVSVNADTSDSVITKLGIRDKVEEAINLATIQTLHVVGMKNNPKTRILLLRLNKGLLGLRDDGTFRALAEKHLGG